ncbi:MarR family transcriptional regulator [Mucilaginibacter pallidiroseus]|uniref:MarR family transcriptional regulator n=1 Tax=Mucilaginibacter pallidiroseus TaxID=2599295 RepID=A0A563TZ42_9SPHI|nr:MarR family transcriptional regulator [Mucilaginibacter pallidiroseus]TWR23871.1 MarR family transcriptional regulator [Mucilaginibacter pallidiroseus]
MNLYQSLGYLVLGSRLRRLSETFLSEINRIYQTENIEFDASWFPVFYLLSKNDSLSIRELSDQTGVSHPAASQLITNLKAKDIVETTVSTDDGRKQLVQLTEKGKAILNQILPIWNAITESMDEMTKSNPGMEGLLPAITALEDNFKPADLPAKVSAKIRSES